MSLDQNKKFLVSTFYKFTPTPDSELASLQEALLSKGEELKLKGLLLIGTEGVNSTLAGTPEAVTEYKSFLLDSLNIEKLTFKDSWAHSNPFKRWKVKIRKEIVTIGDTELVPESDINHHLSPTEWNEVIKNEDPIVIDTRNAYETEMGKFKSAIDPNIDNFQEFSSYIQKSDISKEQKVLIYCTGGIRCEKAILEMNKLGYENVFQLDGGILNYLKQYPNDEYEGECFVFDHRVGVDQNLNPSEQYRLCPHCGNPGDVKINCIQCKDEDYACKHCLSQKAKKPWVETCSKNCAHHFRIGSKTKRPHMDSLRKRGRAE